MTEKEKLTIIDWGGNYANQVMDVLIDYSYERNPPRPINSSFDDLKKKTNLRTDELSYALKGLEERGLAERDLSGCGDGMYEGIMGEPEYDWAASPRAVQIATEHPTIFQAGSFGISPESKKSASAKK